MVTYGRPHIGRRLLIRHRVLSGGDGIKKGGHRACNLNLVVRLELDIFLLNFWLLPKLHQLLVDLPHLVGLRLAEDLAKLLVFGLKLVEAARLFLNKLRLPLQSMLDGQV